MRETLDALLRGVWAGDADAAARLVSQHGAEISRLVRLYLTDPHPCRPAAAPAFAPSALPLLLVRAAAGRFDFREPEELRLLLAALSHRLAVRALRVGEAAPLVLAPPGQEEVHHE